MTKIELQEFLSNHWKFWPEGLTKKKLVEMKREELERVYRMVISERDSHNRIAEYTRIEPPIFHINGHTLNEYELRQLMVDLSWGRFQNSYHVQDCKGNWAVLQSNGVIAGELYGLDLITNSTIRLLQNLQRSGNEEEVNQIKETLLGE